MKKLSQRKQIELWLISGKDITPQIALSRFRCFRLASVIHKLRSKGWNIETEMVHTKCYQYAKYKLNAKKTKVNTKRKQNPC